MAEFAASAHAPTTEARAITAASCLDWLAVGRAGAQEPVANLVRSQGLDEGGRAQASVFGTATLLPARSAALINGTISHALDYDDTHFAHIGHPSVAVFPASLAVAEARGASIREWLDASLIGLEASVRVGMWLGREHYQIGFHQTGTAGAFGAMLAAGRLTGLSRAQTEHGLGLVATRAGGLKAQFGTMGKPLNAGLAASTGVEACAWAKQGFLSNPNAVEAFAQTHHGAADNDAWSGLGQTWLFPGVSHKFHACCHGLHAALEAVKGQSAERISSVTVHTHPRWMSVCNQPDPDTGLGVKFSYRAALGLMLHGHDTARLDVFSDALARDPTLHATRDKISVTADDTIGEMQTRVVLRRGDGSEETLFHDLDAPQPVEARAARVLSKARGLIGAQADDIRAALEKDGPVSEISQFLRA